MLGHFRLRPRYPIHVRVGLRRPDERSSREIQGETENLGFGGIFVRVEPPLALGTRVVVSIASATTWEPLNLAGSVQWVRDARPGVTSGMGIAFESLMPEHALAIHRLIGAHGFDDEREE